MAEQDFDKIHAVPCSQGESIRRIDQRTLRLQEVFYGNGKKGIREQVNQLTVEVDSIKTDLNIIKSDVKVLVQFQTQVETKAILLDKMEANNSMQRRWIIGLAISTGITVLTFTVAAVIFVMRLTGG